MKHANEHSNSQEGSTGQRGLEADGTLDFLKKAEIPVNRANYLALRFMDPKITPETDLGGEIEMDIPEALRHPNHRPGGTAA
jgi:hypothetical protein